uniref:Uncharacterized protein n=1 Tax=Yersinia enterocolitica TaxID=630 RepID=B0RKP4_YEREN|nr:hypothetical protein [Yersinia enterocolitica]
MFNCPPDIPPVALILTVDVPLTLPTLPEDIEFLLKASDAFKLSVASVNVSPVLLNTPSAALMFSVVPALNI